MSFVLLVASAAATVMASPKNVLVFLVDDGGFESSVYGNTVVATPNLDAFASKGTIFDNAYTAVSSCSPSRASILSGLPSHQNGMYGLHQFPGNFQCNNDISSVVNLLNKQGYKTGIIGKHHVGPLAMFDFDYGTTKEHCWSSALGDSLIDENVSCVADYNLVTRNATEMKINANTFFSLEPEKPFFLYVAFGDVHRCGFDSAVGSFCEFFGSGKPGQGSIPDWQPVIYDPASVTVPPWLPDTPAVRADLAGQYTAANRMDQTLGVLLKALDEAGHANDTLIIYTSDNGIPFVSGKTNFFEQGHREPLVVVSPDVALTSGVRNSAVVSALDLMPTILSWTGVSYPGNAKAGGSPARLSGSSLLALLGETKPGANWRNTAFGSHQFHSLYAYYPMRTLRTDRYRLIHNLNFNQQFAILEDVWGTTAWAQLENGTTPTGVANNTLGWIYPFAGYMHRAEFQMFDMQSDPLQLTNLATSSDPAIQQTFQGLVQKLHAWRQQTNDPWLACNQAVPGSPLFPVDGHVSICSF